MAEGSHDNSLKKSLLGWATGALKKIESAIDTAAQQPPAPARAAKTGELTPPAGSGRLSGPLSGQARAGGNTDGLTLSGAKEPAPVQGSGPLPAAPAKSPEEQAEESKKRLKMILAYMKDPASDPIFKNKPIMYRILTEERTYQQGLIVELTRQLEQLPPPAASMGLSEEQAAADPVYNGLEERRKDLQDRLHVYQTRQTQLFTLMKKLTGVKGKTGGTGFIGATPPPDAPGDQPPAPAG